MAELAEGTAAVALSDKRRRRRRAARIAVAKPAESAEGQLLVQAEVEATKSKDAQEPKTNAMRPARQDSEGARRSS